ncbi:helix-turn-helix domain-containing protein [Desulfofalx alkaliphila]|uniref:helix-turn-helix domain-containing protein n=1 Tax=Desulfofalx alkaliphila TaxID=105483 RepID=UPI0004E1126D|nr:helix-turn-helix domain-containing protein [Desulfofalx alkaliphila]
MNHAKAPDPTGPGDQQGGGEMYCQKCGTKTEGSVNFCAQCGIKFEQSQTTDPMPKMYTVQGVLTEYFQGTLGESKLREWVRQGKIPHTRIGRRIIFRKEALDIWFDEQEKASMKVH